MNSEFLVYMKIEGFAGCRHFYRPDAECAKVCEGKSSTRERTEDTEAFMAEVASRFLHLLASHGFFGGLRLRMTAHRKVVVFP